ncbi:Putative phosphotransferase, php family [Pyrococcus yayanosii CH1]|uniref:Putative phosphotransferase, php family n=1 Tax=Pyrococcus yayanosii (strain CH1 / JCM 16557) TaxID=529709 RepID=F8AF16_PYRYC|nr:Putative phosphotransferase, php family [Pyrococcus yayanosii CH1]
MGLIIDNVSWAEARGLRLVGISDHIHYLTPATFRSYVAEVRRAAEESEVIVLVGVEANILDSGPDITDDFTEKLDYVIASVHDWFGVGEVHRYLERIKLALMDKNVDVIGHFGNIFPWIGYPSQEELLEIVELAEAYGKAFEISSRYRVPEQEFIKLCVRRGVKLTFASDAHRPEDVGALSWSIKVFERAGGKKEDLLFSDLL